MDVSPPSGSTDLETCLGKSMKGHGMGQDGCKRHRAERCGYPVSGTLKKDVNEVLENDESQEKEEKGREG